MLEEEIVANTTGSIPVYIVIARTSDDHDEEEVVAAIKTKIKEGNPSTTAGGVLVIDDCSATLSTYLQQQADARAVEMGATAMMCASATFAVPETAVPATTESIQSGTFAKNLDSLMVVLQDDVEYDEPSPPPSASTSTPTESPSELPVVAIIGSPTTETPVVESSESPTETPVVEPTKLPTELPTDEVLEETGTPTNEPTTDKPTGTFPITDSPIDDETDSSVETAEVTAAGESEP